MAAKGSGTTSRDSTRPDASDPGAVPVPDVTETGATPDGIIPPDPAAPDNGEGTAPATPSTAGDTPDAAPLTPPVKRSSPITPAARITEPSAAVRQVPGGGHVAIVDHQGSPLTADDLFTDPGAQFTYMLAATRILQRFRFPGQREDSSRVGAQLIYHQGTRVPRHDAHALMETARQAAEAEQAGGQDS